jgi:hypothetical protein
LKPPIAFTDCGVRPMWPITGISASRIASMVWMRDAFAPSTFTACAPAWMKRPALRTDSSTDTWYER